MVSAEKFLLIPNENSLKEAEALNSFGLLYASGYSAPQDYKIALIYFRKAAKWQHADAVYNLSVAYEYGFGVDKNQPLSDEISF